jgi:hypothetical protein
MAQDSQSQTWTTWPVVVFASISNPTLEAFIHCPLPDDNHIEGFLSPPCTGFCGANLGPQDALIGLFKQYSNFLTYVHT